MIDGEKRKRKSDRKMKERKKNVIGNFQEAGGGRVSTGISL